MFCISISLQQQLYTSNAVFISLTLYSSALSAFAFYHTFKLLSRTFLTFFLNRLSAFAAFCHLSATARLYYHSYCLLSTTFLTLFSSERRRRDLNPRAAINDLHPFQGCPFGQLGYFSRAARTRAIFSSTLEKEFFRILFTISSLSMGCCPAERMGFEPMCPCGQTVFKTASL